ncbi:hypothetical protein [Actinoplanes sp. CA-252034]|uniref:hypothetical protein n=1 Tax=Actinoplanes sp. CA-252034 TaxID=3239906 RepID=UPI003D99F16A
MTAPGNYLMYFILTLAIVMSTGYAVGRIHQWHRHGMERDEAYRVGYDEASRSIMRMMGDPNAAGRPLNSTTARLAAGPYTPREADPAPGHRIPVNQRRVYPAHRS